MKLNPDCMRAVLMAVEDAVDGTIIFEYSKDFVPERLKLYAHNEILYHFRQCSLSGLLVGFREMNNGDCFIAIDLSPAGHSFLENTRKDKNWERTKEIAKRIGSTSVDALVQISSNVITELIKAQFNLS